MANARELVKRRKSVSNTRKITRTMELVASSKARKAQEAAEAARPYAEELRALVSRLAAVGGSEAAGAHPLMARRELRRVVLLVATSDRGLCGSFNANIVRCAVEAARKLRAAGAEVRIVCLGKKGGSALRFLGFEPAAVHSKLMDKPRYDAARKILEPIITEFLAGDIDAIHVAYPRFVSASRHEPRVDVVVPVMPPTGAEDSKPADGVYDLFEYHPDPASLLEAVVPQTVYTGFFSVLLQTAAGEHNARRMAMKNATDAAKDLQKFLTRSYNRARQGKITQEIAEIVGAVEAMS
jgi:F-type H+-transporting ATPase subunit gamma